MYLGSLHRPAPRQTNRALLDGATRRAAQLAYSNRRRCRPRVLMLIAGVAPVLALLTASTAAGGSANKCTPNPSCKKGGTGPGDREPGCKACIDPVASYNCASCCPGYTMRHSGTVSYCTTAAPPAPPAQPPLIDSFSAWQRDRCGGGFIGCPADGSNLSSST
jgi:hypothetical protein